jgi:hypothetical protein
LRQGLLLFALATTVRLACVAWAPGRPTGDGLFYEIFGQFIAKGAGYVNLDGSPHIQWMPGWPYVIAAVYSAFGVVPKAVLVLNALMGAATAALVGGIGSALFARRIGLVAGVLYALWPGLVFFSASFYSENCFALVFTLILYALARSVGATSGRLPWHALAGVSLGGAALVRSEPLALTPVILLFLWRTAPSAPAALRSAALVLGLACGILSPWVIRNYRLFDRFIPTSAGGGMVVYLGHHAGARGGNDLRAAIDYRRQAGTDLSVSERTLAMNETGWRDAARFARENPGAELRLALNKLRLTYGGDADGATLLRGFSGSGQWQIPDSTRRRLAQLADVYWFAALGLAALGLTSLATWPPGAAILLLGTVATWLCIHLVFLGGARFHTPEIAVYALLAAHGAVRLRALVSSPRWGSTCLGRSGDPHDVGLRPTCGAPTNPRRRTR